MSTQDGGATGFARTYGVGLLLTEPAQLDSERLLAAVRRRCGRVEPLVAEKADTGSLLFAYLDHPVQYESGEAVAAQTFILPSNAPLSESLLEQALAQSWDFPDAHAAVSEHRATIYVTDFLASGLPYQERLALFHEVVTALLDELSNCVALHWVQSQRIVDPAQYRQLRAGSEADDPVYPAVNVRLFNVQGRQPGEMLMDTIGLAALGLPDLQCHFVDLDVNSVATMLYGTAYYVYENGDVIEDGESVQGVGEGVVRWRCRHEDALMEPTRIVLDIDPGPPYAAGEREE